MAERELYEIVTATATYRYTSSSEDVVRLAETYTAVPIRREAIVQTDDLNRAGLSLYALTDLGYVQAARVRPLAAVVTVYAYDEDTAAWLVIWKGRVTAVALQGSEAQIRTEGLVTETQRRGLYARYQTTCRYNLYDTGCLANPALFSFAGTVSVITGLVVTIPGLVGAVDGFYTGGYVVFDNGDYRMVTAHSGNDITLYAVSPGLLVGAGATVYAGCDHTVATCTDKFNNLLNFGGFPWLPSETGYPLATVYPRKRRR